MKSPVGTPLSLMVSVCTLFALLLVGGCKSEEKGRTASLPPPLVGVMTVEGAQRPGQFHLCGADGRFPRRRSTGAGFGHPHAPRL